MKLSLFLTLLIFLTSLGSAEGVSENESISLSTEYDGRLPGVTFSEGVGQITGTAISPLLGVSAVGAWQYYDTEVVLRSQLPWYSSPWVWGSGCTILILCFLKDTLGTVLPSFLKKPADVLELFENKASALVASAAFVPSVVSQLELAGVEDPVAGSAGGFHLASIIFGMSWGLIPFFIFCFLNVFVVFNAINVLILLSPFGLIDAMLKLFRIAFVGAIVAAYMIHPYLGLALSFTLFLIAAWLAPKALRISIFGFHFAWDTVMNLLRSKKDHTREFCLFSVNGELGVPLFSKINVRIEDDGKEEVSYAKWFLAGSEPVAINFKKHLFQSGLTFSSLIVNESQNGEARRVAILLPRTGPSLPAISESLTMEAPLEGLMLRSGKRTITWVKELLGKSTMPRLEASDHL